jgi:hypothetical protein
MLAELLRTDELYWLTVGRFNRIRLRKLRTACNFGSQAYAED